MWRVRASQPRDADDADASAAVTPRIRYPAPGTIIALDPDIPRAHQRVAFVASPVVSGTRWRLDETELPDRHGRVLWAPTPGSHTLVLEDAGGTALSRVEFEVRGNLAPVSATAYADR
jgi:penicillin-binding protein 1C